jgi:hypothetical protein
LHGEINNKLLGQLVNHWHKEELILKKSTFWIGNPIKKELIKINQISELHSTILLTDFGEWILIYYNLKKDLKEKAKVKQTQKLQQKARLKKELIKRKFKFKHPKK